MLHRCPAMRVPKIFEAYLDLETLFGPSPYPLAPQDRRRLGLNNSVRGNLRNHIRIIRVPEMEAIMTVIHHPSGRKKRRPFSPFPSAASEYRGGDECLVFRDAASHRDSDAPALNNSDVRINQVAKKRRASLRLVKRS